MPNLRAMIVGPLPNPLPSGTTSGPAAGTVGVYLWASNGSEAWVTKAQIRAHFLSETGTTAQRKAATVAWLKAQAQAALGGDMLDAANVTADIDEADGTPLSVEVS